MSPRLLAAMLLFCRVAGFAQSSHNGASAFQPNVMPALEIRRISGVIQIDGELNDAGWSEAAAAVNFAETQPGDQIRPPVETEVRVAYDDANFYIAFIAHDDPKSIRCSLRDRDQIWADDNIGIILDTYGDAAWAYEIFVNPLGIQGDLRWTPQGEDDGFNIIYNSRGKITATGYQVEVAIPFSSLRFPDKPAQTWRATFWRNHPRDSRRQYSWSALNRDNPCFPCQFGTLTGIENVKSGSAFELLPSVIGFQSARLRDFKNPNSGLANSKIDGAASLGLQYAFTPSLTAEATYNPDFSQVESDAAQIDVNRTFALFYSERRPFFQEGNDLFNLWQNAFYSRMINDPIFAAKLTGRMNRTSIAYIGGRDEHSPIILPFEERSAFLQAGKSTSNILRIKQTFLQDSYLGGLITDRRLDGGGSGTVVGLDGLLRFWKNYRIEAQTLFSRTKEPQNSTLNTEIFRQFDEDADFDRGKHTVAFDGESFGGHAIYASFERDARHLNFDFDYWAASPAFRADNGFITSNDYRQAILWTSYFFYPNTKLLDRFNPSVTAGRFWNYAGVRKDNWIRPAINFQFKAQTNVFIGSVFSTERFREKIFSGIRRLEVNVNSNFSNPLTMGFWFARGRFIARNLADPVLGRGNDFQLWATIKPMQRIIIQPEYAYSELNYPDGREIFSGYILRTRINYQFTREFFLRLITQYNDFNRGFNVEPLLSYKLNAFTIFYIGSTHQYLDLDPNRNDLTQTSRQFFMKFQYLVRI